MRNLNESRINFFVIVIRFVLIITSVRSQKPCSCFHIHLRLAVEQNMYRNISIVLKELL